MNANDFIDKDQDGVPDEEMPELSEADFARAAPNRFAGNFVRLDADVARHFSTSKEINDALRLVIQLSEKVLRSA